MNKKYIKRAVIITGAMLLLAGCNQTDGNQTGKRKAIAGLQELGNIHVISREDGSGTRSTFAELADFLAEDSSDGGKTDLTTEDAVIANDSEEVIKNVENDKSAIGYISGGAFTGSEDVTVLKVDNMDPIKDDKYSLSRNFYLAYSGKLSDLERDFLTYVHGAGQSIVGEDYEPVAKSSFFLSNLAEGNITIEGSTSVAPLMEKLAEAYEELNKNATVTVTATDSSKGLTRAMSGECDFGMASRNLKDYEKELLDYESIARDNILVIVDKRNPLDDITLDELKGIYTGEIKNWDELNE